MVEMVNFTLVVFYHNLKKQTKTGKADVSKRESGPKEKGERGADFAR